MSNTSLKYPAFDSLESSTELEFSNHHYQKLKPVISGETISELLNYQAHATGNTFLSTHGFQQAGATAPYLNKILVVYFYSKHWGSTGLEHLKQLNAIRNEVKYHDGSLLVIDTDGDGSILQQLLWSNNLSLQVYADPAHKIAALFKVYSEDSPSWSRYAGIDSNVPLPALFVLNHFLRVVFAHPNEEINMQLPAGDIVNAVYQSNHYQANKKSA